MTKGQPLVSTTVVALLTDIETDPSIWAVITVREDTDPDTIQDATTMVSRHAILLTEDEDVDEMELRASLASELKTLDLTLESIRCVSQVTIGV